MEQRPNLDVQPEPDLSPAELASTSLGLALGGGLIIGALLGALAGHFLLNGVFGWGQDEDVAIGAVIGAIIGAILSIGGVKALSSRMAHRNS